MEIEIGPRDCATGSYYHPQGAYQGDANGRLHVNVTGKATYSGLGFGKGKAQNQVLRHHPSILRNSENRGATMISWPQMGHHRNLEPFDDGKYEYAITEGPRKGHVEPPAGNGWAEIDWVRDDYTDAALWRRQRNLLAISE